MISLRQIDSSNYRECIELSVAPDQQRFVASNLQSLADAYVWREAAEPYAVYSDDEMVGFALLFPLADGGDDDAIPEPGTERGYILVRLMIDDRFQGHGYGRAALDAIVRDRELPTIRLSVCLRTSRRWTSTAEMGLPRPARSTAARSSWSARSRLA